jgi:hypothetical protein
MLYKNTYKYPNSSAFRRFQYFEFCGLEKIRSKYPPIADKVQYLTKNYDLVLALFFFAFRYLFWGQNRKNP